MRIATTLKRDRRVDLPGRVRIILPPTSCDCCSVRPMAFIGERSVCVRWPADIYRDTPVERVAFVIAPFVSAVFANRHLNLEDGVVVSSGPHATRARAQGATGVVRAPSPFRWHADVRVWGIDENGVRRELG